MTASALASDGEEVLALGVGDARLATAYLLARESDEYIAVMEVLETSVTDVSAVEVAAALSGAGITLEPKVVETRLESLRRWTAASGRPDSSQIRRHADLLSRNWRYTATPVGRQVQRFYRTVLAGTPTLREIPLPSLARLVGALEFLVAHPEGPVAEVAEQVGGLFISQDDLDGALVGSEDALAGLADRFDLDPERAAELKEMLVSYAARVAVELERGVARARTALTALAPRFADLADAAVKTSEARELIGRGALTASRGGRTADWEGLATWCDPDRGRAARFSHRLVRALPGMHANLRRLHTSSGTATGRARALMLARACLDPDHGTAVLMASLGDHPWRKLHGAADDEDLTRNPAWRDGPEVAIPELLRATGRAGARGRPPAARDDTGARATVAARRRERVAAHADNLEEVLAARPGVALSDPAARLALTVLLAAVRSGPVGDRRFAAQDGLACTLWHTGEELGVLASAEWRVLLPGRTPTFHRPGRPAARPATATRPDPGDRIIVSRTAA